MKSDLKNLIEQIENDGGKLKLCHSKEYLRVNGEKCSGYYDEDSKTLFVACKKPFKEWFAVLVHEYAHLLQDKNNTKHWKAWKKICNFNFDIDDWLLDKNLNPSPKDLDAIYEATVALEREAETIALDAIDRLNLPLNKDNYIKSANCYLMFYFWSRAHRLWYKKAPYRIPKILNKMPTHLLTIKQMKRDFHRFDYSSCFME